MLQTTLEKFWYPATLVKEYDHWLVLARPRQVTLGSLVLMCRDEVTAFADISNESSAQLPLVIKDIERTLKTAFKYDKINYLMLMMVDPEVHFHVIPRYERAVEFASQTFKDYGWPDVPALKEINELEPVVFEQIITHLKQQFN